MPVIRGGAILISFMSAGWVAAATGNADLPKTGGEPSKSSGSIPELITRLSDENFHSREIASRTLWDLGEAALGALEAAAKGDDPEQAYRSRELIKKIELNLTSETDPEVMKMVERYATASLDEKQNLIEQMHQKRAWRQILKLYAGEKNPQIRTNLQQPVAQVALIAARESLMAGNPKSARDYLEMAPADAAGLLALADFHRSQGTLAAELERAKTLKGEKSAAWQLALYRAAGNLEAARDAATAAGEKKISAQMALLLGDPLPWMRGNLIRREGEAIHRPYTEFAIQRWSGKVMRAASLDPLREALKSRNSQERQSGINALFLLGEIELAEAALIKESPIDAFVYLDSLERVPEALSALGLDPEAPDYASMVAKRMEKTEEFDQDEGITSESKSLRILANFLERRGLREEFAVAFTKPLLEFAERDPQSFPDFMGQFFGDTVSDGAPEFAKEIAFEWAGDDAIRWDEIVAGAFGGEEETTEIWEWLAELDPKAGRVARFDAMLALRGMGTDPTGLRSKWHRLAWDKIEAAPPADLRRHLQNFCLLIQLNPNAETHLKLWAKVAPADRETFFNQSFFPQLTVAGRWDEAAEFFLTQISRVAKFKLDPIPSLHSCAASCLRKAGRLEEAAEQDKWADQLALGSDAYDIAMGYQYGDDFKRAAQWLERAARLVDPRSGVVSLLLNDHGEMLLDQGRWTEAASVYEAMAQMAATQDSGFEYPVARLRLRLQADLSRALASLNDDREASIALLTKCHGLLPGDGSLADYFFPALRKMRLTKEHDEWFKISWAKIGETITKYPGSHNTCNTAAWLASRAGLELKAAKALQERALAMRPEQSAYLDTMAELWFASGDRKAALKWSSLAINYSPASENENDRRERFMLRRQHEHFRTDPLLK